MNILQQIYQDKLLEVQNKKCQICPASMLEQAQQEVKNVNGFKNKNFANSISQKLANRQIAIIAEVKKASPSKGIIRANFNPLEIAKSYSQAGATCLSVLTDEKYFQGKNEYLIDIANNVDLPILRKDFIVDKYQIWEAKLIGADAILLIMAMLNEQQALELEEEAIKMNLDVLIEIHNQEELKKALKLQSPLIGINNRNLKTFEISLQTSIELAGQIPEDKIIICESGIFTKADIVSMQEIGINSFLIGESLMKQKDVELALKSLL